MKKVVLMMITLLAAIFFGGCKSIPDKKITEQEVATLWADMTLHVTRHTPSNSPTYASRALGYIGVTMYESVVAGFDSAKSLGGQLNGLRKMPSADIGKKYSWILALNSGQAQILRKLYDQTSEENKVKIDSLERVIQDLFSRHLSDDVVHRSIAHGKNVANQIFEWSKADGGHRGYLKNFDKTLVISEKKGGWKPPLFGQSISRYPLHPHWGKNRSFLKENSLLPLPEVIPYSTEPGSKYYNEYRKVYEKSKLLTQEEKETSLWWGDDPGDTFTPPGHSYNLGTIIIKKQNPPLIKCAETYARIGIAVADSFINCWKLKYHFYSERPSTFIFENIDEEWEPFWPDPPFPAFPSGHATQAGAASSVLGNLYGDATEISDSSHVGHERNQLRELDYKARSFMSLSQLAQEVADSRFFGGIHTDQDNIAGLQQGNQIGQNINRLNWLNENHEEVAAQ